MGVVKRVLMSVSDKSGLAAFAGALSQMGVEILATGGTAALLTGEHLAITDVSAVTQFPEILNGRVKTLHPNIFGGILYRRDDAAHRRQIEENGIGPVDMVVVNLYPFEETIAQTGVTLQEAIEKIDIGGPSLLRAAAKNHADVAAVPDARFYDRILEDMRNNNGAVSDTLCREMARDVFRMTAAYDRAIHEYLETAGSSDTAQDSPYPDVLRVSMQKIADLRYGENPHQAAAAYRDLDGETSGLFAFAQLQGKALSFNNYLDLDGAWRVVSDFSETCTAIIKHTNPCGVALGDSPQQSFQRALACDPMSAFGGIVACNQAIDLAMAEEIAKTFFEAVIAPAFTSEAQERLSKKKKLALMRAGDSALCRQLSRLDYKRIAGGFLVQETDTRQLQDSDITVVTERHPTAEEFQALRFGWKIVKHAKSNGIVFASRDQLLGIGVGQMSRIDSTEIAVRKAGQSGFDLQGSIVASDAFFPFRDGLDALARVGAVAVIQPGGSIRDEEVIAAANEANIAMVFTGYRVFRH